MDETVFAIVRESNEEKRMLLFEEYMDYQQMWKLYDNHDLEGIDKFSWKLCFEKEWLSLQNLGHFKDEILLSGEVTEKEWNEYANHSIKYMGEEKVKQHLKDFDEYRLKHEYAKKIRWSKKQIETENKLDI
jgi:hypothetical protein